MNKGGGGYSETGRSTLKALLKKQEELGRATEPKSAKNSDLWAARIASIGNFAQAIIMANFALTTAYRMRISLSAHV